MVSFHLLLLACVAQNMINDNGLHNEIVWKLLMLTEYVCNVQRIVLLRICVILEE